MQGVGFGDVSKQECSPCGSVAEATAWLKQSIRFQFSLFACWPSVSGDPALRGALVSQTANFGLEQYLYSTSAPSYMKTVSQITLQLGSHLPFSAWMTEVTRGIRSRPASSLPAPDFLSPTCRSTTARRVRWLRILIGSDSVRAPNSQNLHARQAKQWSRPGIGPTLNAL